MQGQPEPGSAPKIFDRDRLAERATHAWTGAPDFLAALVADDLRERLAPVSRTFGRALIMGPDARALPDTARSATGPITFERASTLADAPGFLRIDPEALVLPEMDYDLIVSLLDLQIVNDVPGFLARIRRHLAPDGLFVAAVIGGRSLSELRAAWLTADAELSGGAFARVAPFMDVRDAGSLLQRTGFALPVTDIESHKVRYADPLALIRELKTLGASNPLAEKPTRMTTRPLLAAALEAYGALAGEEDGRVAATLEIVWMSGWAPHESQQKPLKPGSAEVSLTKVLGKNKG